MNRQKKADRHLYMPYRATAIAVLLVAVVVASLTPGSDRRGQRTPVEVTSVGYSEVPRDLGIPIDLHPDVHLCWAATGFPGLCGRWDREDVQKVYDFYVTGPGANADKAAGLVCRSVPNLPAKALCKFAVQEKWAQILDGVRTAQAQGVCAELRIPFSLPAQILTTVRPIPC